LLTLQVHISEDTIEQPLSSLGDDCMTVCKQTLLLVLTVVRRRNQTTRI